MPENHPTPEPFDPSRYTPAELDSARHLIHALYRPHPDSVAPEGPFDPALYDQRELALVAEVVAALRRGPSQPTGAQAKVIVKESAAVEWRRGEAGECGSQARLVLRRTTTTRLQHHSSTVFETLGALTDWFDCPQPLDTQRQPRPADALETE